MPVIAATLFTDGMTRYVAACMLVSPAVVCLCTLGDKPAARGCAIQNWALLTIDLRVYLAFVTFSPSKRRMFRNRLGVWPRIAPLLDIHGLAATVTLVLNVPNRLSDTG